MLKDYQEKENLVLDQVKKNPLSSVDRLSEVLPGVSRRSIQEILEKNQLSTADRRLAFANEKKSWLEQAKTIRGESGVWLKKVGETIRVYQLKPQLNWSLARNLTVLAVLSLAFFWGMSLASAKPPEITLEHPEVGFASQGEKLFVTGQVVPANSQVTISGQPVSLNGDGTFTAVINLPLGESTLEVEAVNWRKKSRLVRLVRREPTEEELAAQQEREAEKRRLASNRVAELEGKVNDLLAAKNATGDKKSLLRILNNHIQEKEGFYSIGGEVVNLGEEEVSWVMITAKFYNQENQVVDTRHGFATDFGQVLRSGEKSAFETQATVKKFDHYSLDLSWEEGKVAGQATQSATPTATPSASVKE